MTPGIAAVRIAHGALSLMFLSCIGIVYYSALTRRRGRLLALATAALVTESVIIVANRGVCPLGSIHHAVGDQKTFFELFLPRAAAKAAVPVLGAVTAGGYALLVARR